MKKILLLLLCGFVVALSSCKDDSKDGPDFRFSVPEVTGVTETTANVSCLAGFNVAGFPGLTKGFVYSRADDVANQCWEVTNPSVDGRTMSARLTNLEPGVRYWIYAFASLGASSFESALTEFETLSVSGDDPVLEIVSQTTIQATAQAGSYEIRYEVLNPAEGVRATAASDADWIESFDNSTSGSIAFRVRENTTPPRQAVVTVSYPGAQPRQVTVSQASGETPVPDEPVFGAPSHASVTASGAFISCSFTYEGSGAVSRVWFAYKAGSGSEQQAAVSVSAGDKSAALTGLSASTTYTYRLCVEVGGNTFTSGEGSFTTLSSGGGQTGNTKYSGWAELPTEITKSGDYYYAYHMRSDMKSVRNFSVCYSAKYRCPVWIAAPMHRSYKGSAKRKDNYIDDPDVSCTQNTSYDFSSTNLTRGHMLGSSDRTVTQATNDQVFYKTNIAPQLQTGFNQSGGLWNNCESWVDQQWVDKSDTTYQIIGCYWENEKEKVNGTTVPTHFYKVLLRTKNHVNKWVSTCSRDELQCIVVFFPHNSAHKGTKPSQYKSKGFLMTVAELEEKTDLTFFSNVPNAPKDTYNVNDWGF